MSSAEQSEFSAGIARSANYAACGVLALAVYLLSSGPVIAIACWLREATQWDGWYGVFYLYYPAFYCFGRESIFFYYIEFWVVNVFHTVGPG